MKNFNQPIKFKAEVPFWAVFLAAVVFLILMAPERTEIIHWLIEKMSV